ncbi:MAG: hypothetical protein JW864_18430 [Spirochaetes bacterium]|nr:hypothetical protein [Spirochaetota bacterium]
MKKIIFLISVIFLFFTASRTVQSEELQKNSISVYNGFLTPKDVSELLSTPPAFRSEYFAGAGYLRELFSVSRTVSFHGEGQFVYHYGSQYYAEYVLALYIACRNVINNKYVITSSIGDGVSWSEKILHHEHRRNRKSTHYINYLGIEVSFGKIKCPVELVIRLHHRSSAYGLIMDGNTDSNFICTGLRYKF